MRAKISVAGVRGIGGQRPHSQFGNVVHPLVPISNTNAPVHPTGSARIVVGLVFTLLFATAIVHATNPAPATTGGGLGFPYDPAQEVVFVGTMQGFVAHPVLGSPAGLQLLISSAGKLVNVHVGPYFSKQNQQALQAGQLVQVTGVQERVHGKNLFLAREVVFQGRLVTVRNHRGFLVRNLGPSPRFHASTGSVNGGTR